MRFTVVLSGVMWCYRIKCNIMSHGMMRRCVICCIVMLCGMISNDVIWFGIILCGVVKCGVPFSYFDEHDLAGQF